MSTVIELISFCTTFSVVTVPLWSQENISTTGIVLRLSVCEFGTYNMFDGLDASYLFRLCLHVEIDVDEIFRTRVVAAAETPG